MAQLSPPTEGSQPVTPIPQSPPNEPITTTPPTGPIQVGIASHSLASNTAVLNSLVDLINAVYTVAEAGIFNAEYRRTNITALQELILASELAIAWVPSSPFTTPPPSTTTTPTFNPTTDRIIGCARVQSLSPSHGVFGMLVCDPAQRGGGTGKRLVQFTEEYAREVLGKTVMQCELLVNAEEETGFKKRMHEWYQRMGYMVVRNGDFGGEYPVLKPCLVTRVEFRVYEKPLV